jgi:hypothetical protein
MEGRRPSVTACTTTSEDGMASSGKRKTTMAKLNRERRLRERRMEKQVRKDLRKREAAEQRRQLADGSAESD